MILPLLERHSLRAFAGRGLLNPIDYARDIAARASKAGVVTLSLKNRDGEQHHLRVVGMLSDELFGIVEGAIIISKLLACLDKGAIDGGSARGFRKSPQIIFQVAYQRGAVISGGVKGFLQLSFGLCVAFRI
jgi:hypothetical protein